MEDHLQYRVPENVGDFSLAVIVTDDYALKVEGLVDGVVTFYDTFDWRLFNKSLALCHTGDELIVLRLPAGVELVTLACGSPPTFARQLGDGRLRHRVALIAGDRRLFRVGEASIQTLPYRVLDANDKTVARLLSVEVRAARGSRVDLRDAYISLVAVRGYGGHFRRLAKRLTEAGLVAGHWQQTFERIVAVAGKRPAAYSARPDYQLQPGMRSDAAMKEILRRTLAVLRANEEGIKADWDAEFLHDYRTAVRRTRSALSQIPGVCAPEATERYKEAFAQLGERTNQLRDLDVYLLAEPHYRAMLPNAMRDHIAPLFDYLQSQRRQTLREVVDYLDSAPYAALMEAWQAFLHEPVSDVTAAPNAALAIDELARRRSARQYRRVIKDGNRILDSDEDELIHQLRIDCKKLRYLLEFFSSLFPAKEINRLIRQLRILQDKLGVFNDLSVQQDYLLRVAEVFPADDAQGKMALVAIGFLVEKLAGEQQAMKPGLAQVFSEFAAAPNRALFRQLFGDRHRVSSS